MFQLHPLANGTRTDHPVPGLPFVDDSHLPLDEGGDAIEAVGRNVAEGMWGRVDPDRSSGGWRAFTTDPICHNFGWVVRYHPEHGRTVLLMSDGDTASMHEEWWGDPLLFRAGGYWWDGTTWYRPGQVWDPVQEEYERRKVRAAVTVTAADLLDGSADPARAHAVKVSNFDPEAPAPDNWPDHLALWAQLHTQQDDALPLEQCVVNIAAPELSGDQLLGIPEMAALSEIGASTLRSYISRGEGEVPMPQATIGGRGMWSRPVAQDWAEARRRSAEGVKAVLSAGDRHQLSPGAAEVRERFARDFRRSLWERPDWRKRWVLRHRNEESVGEIADDLAWTVAVSMDRILPTNLLSATIRHAVLDEFADDLERHGRKKNKEVHWYELNLTVQVAKMLDWFIRHRPDSAQYAIGEILRETNSRWGVPPHLTGRALRGSLAMDGTLDKEVMTEYLDRVLPPEPAS